MEHEPPARTGGVDRLDEHAKADLAHLRGEASMIGYAERKGAAGPWRETKHGFGARYDPFGPWHLPPGSMLLGHPDRSSS